ncbi:hypothetical protein NMG60_11007196 [Bertholletia excelsa]
MATLGYYEILLAAICFLFLYLLGTIDGLPRDWPLLGMLPSAFLHLHRVHNWATDVLERVGGTFYFKGPSLASMDMLVTVDPANIHYIMSSQFSNFPKGPQFRKIFDILGDGIFNSDAESWKNQRKLAQMQINHHSFHRFLVKTSQDKVEKGLTPVLDHVSNLGMVVDLQDLFQRFTFDTTCILVTGYDPGCLSIPLPTVPFSKAMDDAWETLLMRHAVPESVWKLQNWLGIGQEKKLREAWATIDHVIAQYIAMKRQELNDGINPDEEGMDLLTSYLKEGEMMGLDYDNEFLRDTIINFMIAGRDTTSSALTWFLWLVSIHPTVKSNIREELKKAIQEEKGEGKELRIFRVEEVSNLVYLHSAICEALRLYPPVPFQHKEPLHPDVLPSGHRVRPDMKILFSLYAMGRMKFIWGNDCMEFKPERWILESGKIKHEPSYKFLAFNAGPRTCLGKEMAFIQMKAVAATIIHNYDIQLEKGHSVSPNVSIILYMKHGLKVRVTRRCW